MLILVPFFFKPKPRAVLARLSFLRTKMINKTQYKDLLVTDERVNRLIKVMRKKGGQYWKMSDTIRFCIDFAYRELIEKDERRDGQNE